MMRGLYALKPVLNIRVACLGVIWLSGIFSLFFAPYSQIVALPGESVTRGAWFIMENLSKIILLFIAASLCVRNLSQTKALAVVFLFSGLYLTWWINNRYLFHGAWGRISGPISLTGEGTYADENTFGALFASFFPFVWYAGFYFSRILPRIIFWCAVPAVWHGLFLTGSRGALLAVGVALLIIAIRMRKASLGIGIISAFIVIFVWQAGDTMLGRASSLDEYSEDSSATGRLDAWEAGARMMISSPVTGVGPGAFLRAFPYFSERAPLQAHNTFVQFGAEFGVFSLFALVVMLLSCFWSLWLIRPEWGLDVPRGLRQLTLLREATLAGLAGLVVCSIFLSMQIFELFYFVIFFANILLYINPNVGDQTS
jgi:O-antigen ligase